MSEINQIATQLPKAPAEEPTEWGSVVRAFVCGNNAELWVRTLDENYSGWTNNRGACVSWNKLCEPEVLRVGVGEPATPPAEAVEADKAPHVPCPDCGNDPKDPDQHADGCRRRGLGQHLQFGPPWHPFPEPTPEQVEAASAPAEYVAIEALVVEVARRVWEATDSPGGKVRPILHDFAARVLEVRGQQPGVPVANREAVARAIEQGASDVDLAKYFLPGTTDRFVAALLAADVFRSEATVKAEALEEALASGEFPGLTLARDWIASRAKELRTGAS